MQANCDHTHAAMDLTLNFANDINADIIIVSEPHCYNNNLSSNPGWNRVWKKTVAILIRKNILYKEIKCYNDNTVAITVERYKNIIGTYMPPNKNYMDEIN